MKTAWMISINLKNKREQIIGTMLLLLGLFFLVKAFMATEFYEKLTSKESTKQSQYIWDVRSIETMSQTKDRLCSQPTDKFIQQWIQYAKEANTTHITYSGFYNNQPCANADLYAARWEKAARREGLNIWWRQMFTEFEGIETPVIPQCNDATRDNCNDYIAMMVEHIRQNKNKYRDGDIFSITAEPAADRIRGITCLEADVCTFESATGGTHAIAEFNEWLLQSIAAAEKTFAEIGVDVEVNGGGFDLFVAVGYDNHDWGCDNDRRSILYHDTVEKMGGFVMDHYFDADVDTMQNAINAINYCYPEERYPDLKFQIGEWGPIYGPETTYYIEKTMDAIANAGDRFTYAFNYWQGGPFGQESLFYYDGSNLQKTANYDAVTKQFQRDKTTLKSK